MKRRTVQLARKNSNVFAQFDQKQIAELKEAFSFIDQNGDGVVDHDDLKEVWTSLGSPITDHDIEEMLKDSPGSLNFTMFLAILGDQLQVYSVASPSSASDLIKAFENLDIQKSGKLDVNTFKDALMTMGDRMDEEEASAVLKEAPKADSEGLSIDYREFVRLIKAPF